MGSNAGGPFQNMSREWFAGGFIILITSSIIHKWNLAQRPMSSFSCPFYGYIFLGELDVPL
jgi:hypothetical protein